MTIATADVFASGAVSQQPAAQHTAASPKSWGELLNSYRDSHGSRSYSSASSTPCHYTRSVPGLCPLSETHHPLFSVGATGQHTINDADGSAYRSQRHGWGDTSLLKEGFAGEPHPRGMRQHAAGKRTVAAPTCEGGRNGLWGLLQGSEAGGVDSWIGNASIDPTKGKRSVAAPTDAKRVDMGQLLAQTALGEAFSADAWIGNIGINPAKGKGHAADAAALRGRADLFAILQQRLLQEGGGGGSGRPAVDDDAFIGNQLIVPGKGKKSVDSPAAADTLHGAVFKGPPPAEACWCDMPRIGKRPLVPPSNARCFVTAAQAMAVEVPLPATAVMGPARPQGKAMLHSGDGSSNGSSSQGDIWALMTFTPLTGAETQRWQQAWTDARAQPRRRALPDATAAGGAGLGLQQLVASQVTVRRVPHAGGIAQEVGCSLDTILANRAAVSGKGDASGGRARGGRSSTGGRGNKAAGRSGGGGK